MAIQVRKSEYRGRSGYLICGRTEDTSFGVRIFSQTKAGATRIAKALRNERHSRERRDRIIRETLLAQSTR